MAYIILNRSNFYHNLSQIALKTGSLDKIAIVLKDNAYGHGTILMARLASEFGISKAVVRNYQEALVIEQYFDDIIILGGEIHPKPNLSYAINSIETLKTAPTDTRIELKIDTGMHRNGIGAAQLPEALSLIEKHGHRLTGLMTHFRSADELGSELFWQQKEFEKTKMIVRRAGFKDIRIHSCNSAALLRSHNFKEDIVRAGIAAYGIYQFPKGFDAVDLKPVLSLHARRVSSRNLGKGAKVGYGGDFTAPSDMRISTYDLGYGDGWRRGSSAKPYTTPDGASFLGRVSMDFVALEGDKEEICIMNDARIAAEHFGTISYETTTALSAEIPRTVI